MVYYAKYILCDNSSLHHIVLHTRLTDSILTKVSIEKKATIIFVFFYSRKIVNG